MSRLTRRVSLKRKITLAPAVTLAAMLLVAGGGGGRTGAFMGAGGGSGELLLETNYLLPYADYNINIGAGGNNAKGGNTIFNGITLNGGGVGGGFDSQAGQDGGSGGGGGHGTALGGASVKTGGGVGFPGGNDGGGGGGAAGPGETGVAVWNFPGAAGNGGPGIDSDITGEMLGYGGGGGAAGYPNYPGANGIATHGGGNGAFNSVAGINARPNSGGGGGGASDAGTGGLGGSGIAVFRYLGLPIWSGGLMKAVGMYTVHIFKKSGALKRIQGATVWNPDDKAGDVAVGATSAAFNTPWFSVRGTRPRNDWRTVEFEYYANSAHFSGFGTGDASLESFPGGSADSFGYYSANDYWVNGSATSTGVTATAGDVIRISFDIPNKRFRMLKNAGDWSTATWRSLSVFPDNVYFLPMVSGAYASAQTARFTLASLQYGVDPGSKAWDES